MNLFVMIVALSSSPMLEQSEKKSNWWDNYKFELVPDFSNLYLPGEWHEESPVPTTVPGYRDYPFLRPRQN